MKTNTLIIVPVLIIFLMRCSNENNYQESRELVPNPEGYKKDSIILNASPTVDSQLINIDESLKDKFGPYLMDYSNGVLSLCCLDELYYPFGSNEKSDIAKFCLNCIDTTYKIEINEEFHQRTKLSNATCELTLLEFEHEDGYVEYSFEDSSYFNSSMVILENGLKIGMSKELVLNKYFSSGNDSIFNSIDLLAVSSDERGELYIQYRFLGDTLNSIIYGYQIYKLNATP